jgi:hypothetical protein
MSVSVPEADLESKVPVIEDLPADNDLVATILERIIPGHDVSAFNSSI